MINNILLGAVEVQPIEPSRIIDAAQGAGQGAVVAGQSLAGSLAFIALFIGGFILLVGVGLAMAHITNKVLKAGAGIFRHNNNVCMLSISGQNHGCYIRHTSIFL